ncbi:unnamed protein product [Allacma fusca]|uniref:NB-ARC domain-containing protein n=1 Tax=Allacma fusca TaxID=39272 RepID=A0A8J2K804_9HEXA|nr:unnamed protein product [Allacma fusca]
MEFPELPPKTLHLFPDCNNDFFPRDKQLSEIGDAVGKCKGGTQAFQKTMILHGFGGIGKTELARDYAQRHLPDYDYIVWFDAQTDVSLNASFKKLAQNLCLSFKTVADVPAVYQKLANHYNSGLFIFDHAERLSTMNKQLGIKEYLYTDFLEKRPICIVTSRNGSSSWGGLSSNIQVIPIDRLSPEETQGCLKKYLQVDGTELPPSLEEAISSIAGQLDGYPLAVSLVGGSMDKSADRISFDKIESRIQGYLKLLEVIPIKDFCNEKDYKDRLKLIFGETTKQLKTETNGLLSLELLNIMSFLSPDDICVKLIYEIYTGQSYDDRLPPDEILNTYIKFMSAMKLLQNYSLIRINDEAVQISRLIQQSAREGTTIEPIKKVLGFFENNLLDTRWRGNIIAIFQALLDGASVENKSYYICMLAWKLILLDEYHYVELKFGKVKELAEVGTPDEQFMLKLVEFYLCLELGVNLTIFKKNTWNDLETGMKGLTEGFQRHGWVIEGCVCAVGKYLCSCEKISENKLNPPERNVINDWIKGKYMKLLPTSKSVIFSRVLFVLYGFRSTRSLKDDAEFIRKWVTSPDPKCRRSFWYQTKYMYLPGKNWDMSVISAFVVDLFTRSLQIQNTSSEPMEKYFLACLASVMTACQNPFEFVNDDFLNAFTEASRIFEVKDDTFLDVALVWLTLFVQDMEIYSSFEQNIEPQFQRFCDTGYFNNIPNGVSWDVADLLRTFTEKRKETGRQANWADKLLAIVQKKIEEDKNRNVTPKPKKRCVIL